MCIPFNYFSNHIYDYSIYPYSTIQLSISSKQTNKQTGMKLKIKKPGRSMTFGRENNIMISTLKIIPHKAGLNSERFEI